MSKTVGRAFHPAGHGPCIPRREDRERNRRIFLQSEYCPVLKICYSVHMIPKPVKGKLAITSLVITLWV